MSSDDECVDQKAEWMFAACSMCGFRSYPQQLVGLWNVKETQDSQTDGELHYTDP